jgi:hypothetical protein
VQATTTFELASVESAVLSGLRKELQHPDLIAEYVRTYHAERQRLAAAANRNIIRLERRRGEIDREVSRLVDGIAKGLGDPQPLGDRMKVTVLNVGTSKPSWSWRLPNRPPSPCILERSRDTSSKLADCKRPLATE